MTTISSNDIIFATVIQYGSTLAQLKLSGMTSTEDIVRKIRETLPDLGGLVNLSLRNATMGWRKLCPVMFERRTSPLKLKLGFMRPAV